MKSDHRNLQRKIKGAVNIDNNISTAENIEIA